jgi:hypothetical protein
MLYDCCNATGNVSNSELAPGQGIEPWRTSNKVDAATTDRPEGGIDRLPAIHVLGF